MLDGNSGSIWCVDTLKCICFSSLNCWPLILASVATNNWQKLHMLYAFFLGRRTDCLRQFLVVLCDRGELQTLVQYQYIDLHDEVGCVFVFIYTLTFVKNFCKIGFSSQHHI